MAYTLSAGSAASTWLGLGIGIGLGLGLGLGLELGVGLGLGSGLGVRRLYHRDEATALAVTVGRQHLIRV